MLYSTKQAAKLIGASAPAIRKYTQQYARYLSTEATPGPGRARQFTEEDVRLLAFVYTATSAGATHEQVAEQLASGELDGFDWQSEPPTEPQEPPADQEGSHTALIPVERLQAAMTLLEDARRREDAAREREDTLQDEIARLRQDLGEARGELSAYKSLRPKRPRWWTWLFGE